MSLERLLKYASITELIGIGIYFLCMTGGFFLETSSPLFRVCGYVAGFLWYTLGILFCLIAFSVMIWFWRYLLGLTMPRTRELTVKKKEKMPIFWLILATAAFFAYMSFTLALAGAGGAA